MVWCLAYTQILLKCSMELCKFVAEFVWSMAKFMSISQFFPLLHCPWLMFLDGKLIFLQGWFHN